MSLRILTPLLAIVFALGFVQAAGAQRLSDGYNFLKAVRDSDGTKVTQFLNEPGQTIVNTRDSDTGETALHIVARRGDTTYLRFLMARGANVNQQDRRGNSPLMIAVTSNFAEGVEVLTRYRANPNLANSSGETPLIRAVQLRNFEIARALLAAGADPDQVDSLAGQSARDYARIDGRSPALARLLADAPRVEARRAVAGPTLP